MQCIYATHASESVLQQSLTTCMYIQNDAKQNKKFCVKEKENQNRVEIKPKTC